MRQVSTQAGLAVFGGTFNPIHHGHLRSALELLEYLPINELRFMPCSQPPHRDTPATSAAQRAAMVELAIAGEPRFSCDTRELKRDGPSYTYDSLRSLRDEIGPRRSLVLAMGCDALLGLNRWHRWQELLGCCHIVAMARPGWEWPTGGEVSNVLSEHRVSADALAGRPSGGVCVAELRQLDISATEIRSLLQSGRSARYLVPDGVHTYIQQNGFYK